MSKNTLSELFNLARRANESTWEAYETDRFSDAKSDVFDVLQYLQKAQDIPAPLRDELLQYAQDGWTSITDRSSSSRATKASHLMHRICAGILEYEKALGNDSNPE